MSLSLQEGFAKKPIVVESMDVGSETFLRLEKSSEWLLKMSGGPKMQRGGLARSRVVEKLRAACGMDSQRQNVNNDTNVDTDDPMQAVDACAYDGVVSEQKHRKAYYHPKRAIEQVVSVEMPTRAVGRSCGNTTSVKLIAKGTNSLWIHLDCLSWLVSYIADECARSGVAVQGDTADSVELPANSAVPGLAIRWDFSSNDSWEGVWVDGPLKGEIVRSSMSSLTPEKWTAIDGYQRFGVSLDHASLKYRKQGVMLFLEKHCASMLAAVQNGVGVVAEE